MAVSCASFDWRIIRAYVLFARMRFSRVRIRAYACERPADVFVRTRPLADAPRLASRFTSCGSKLPAGAHSGGPFCMKKPSSPQKNPL